MLRQAREMIGNRLAGAGKNERSAAEHRAQENLQSAITADVVERAPYRRGVGGTAAGDGRREPGKVVHHHLRHARRARGQQHPFGANGNRRRLVERNDRRRAGDANGERERRMRSRTVVGHDRIDFGCRHHGAEMIGLDIGRQDHQAPRDAVELDQRQRRRQLARGRHQDRTARQIREPAAKTCLAIQAGAASKIGETNGSGAVPNKSRRRRVRDIGPQRRRLNARHVHRLSRSRRASPGKKRPRRP